MPAKPREKLIYKEAYRRPGGAIRSDRLPVLHHTTPTFVVAEAFLLEAGSVSRGEERLEYQVIRVYLREKGEADGNPV
jgi:hypothetical protein